MQTVGLQTAIWNNNLRSLGLLLLFPVLVFAVLMCVSVVGIWFFGWHTFMLDGDIGKIELYADGIRMGLPPGFDQLTVRVAAFVVASVLIWYVIAYFFHERLIDHFAHARPMARKEYPKVYNALENLCISRGLPIPKLGVIETGKLNAFASGITQNTYRITLTRGLIEHLDDEEIEAVLAHELSHILHRDVRLMVIAAIFTGILALLAEGFTRTTARATSRRALAYGHLASRRSVRGAGHSAGRGAGRAAVGVLLIGLVVWVGYILSKNGAP
ncbi:MAG: M48 family metalloprotease [Pseudomonadota bacterium]